MPLVFFLGSGEPKPSQRLRQGRVEDTAQALAYPLRREQGGGGGGGGVGGCILLTRSLTRRSFQDQITLILTVILGTLLSCLTLFGDCVLTWHPAG